ncbi:MAG: isopenicillin N synthase family oxygenase [Proteobacteria bacterium]|nr:isopenicillin N synthase family oxygenase [Pseudomonadota bacterium]
MDHIPLIDFGPFRGGPREARQIVARQIGRACETVGFFYLADHGIPLAKIDAVFAAARRFFTQSEALRMAEDIRITPRRTRGYQPLYARHYANTDAPDVNEAFKYQRELPPDDPDLVAGDRMHQPNQWPAGMPGWRETLIEYFEEVENLARHVLRAFALALDLDETYFLSFYRKPLTQVSLLHYPPHPPLAPERQFGIRPHADATAFTMLAQDDVGGLQVQSGPGWIAAPPIAGSFVINIGDMMARWTNDRFASTPHRVINASGRERFSVPYFAIPDFDAVVECLPSCNGPGSPPKYPPLPVGPSIVRKFATDWRKDAAAST